ncbi:hypothetical protein LPJ53_004869 [Coemansia erecta]|uniref:Uncharacterized protein n=1 Tax=Coemansia erecta TaxID=147472 RepID=A0A9W8CR59_9FUNG|nr:hypothetical protein LPJ53_004869 [Coemansia erecta]
MGTTSKSYIAVAFFVLSAAATITNSVFYMLYDNKYWNPDYPSKPTHEPIRIIVDVGLTLLIVDYLVNHSRAMKQDKPPKMDFYHSYLMFLLISMVGFYDPVSDDVFTAVFAGRHVGKVLSTRELAAGLYDTSVKDGRTCVALTIVSAGLGLAGVLAGLKWPPKKKAQAAAPASDAASFHTANNVPS